MTASKRRRIVGLAVRFRAARRCYVNEFWPTRNYAAVVTRARLFADERRKRGWLRADLSAHQNRVAALSALAIVKGSWLAAVEASGRVISADAALSSTERHWLRYVLKTPRLLQECLNGEVPVVEKPWAAGVGSERLARRLRRSVERNRGVSPKLRSLAFDLDTNLYDITRRDDDRFFRGAWLSLTTEGNYRRMRVPLAGSDLGQFASRTDKDNSRPGLRVDFANGRVRFRSFERSEVAPRESSVEIGVDIGVRTLATVSRGDPQTARSYGDYGMRHIRRIVEEHEMRRRSRQRIEAYERSIRNTSAQKAARIRRANLGNAKGRKRSRSEIARLRQVIGQALNALFLDNADVGVMNVEHLDFRGTRRPRSTNRLLRRWQFAYLQRHLTLKAQLHGVRLNVVNAAWTSLTCTNCGYLSRDNRRSETFECGSCGYTSSADAVAATNILRRGSDQGITRFTSIDDAKRILEERWRSARSGRALGSVDGDDRASSASCEQSELRSLSTAPVPFRGSDDDQPSPQ